MGVKVLSLQSRRTSSLHSFFGKRLPNPLWTQSLPWSSSINLHQGMFDIQPGNASRNEGYVHQEHFGRAEAKDRGAFAEM